MKDYIRTDGLCSSCEYSEWAYEYDADDYFICRRYPPPKKGDDQPIVSCLDYCGEYIKEESYEEEEYDVEKLRYVKKK